jgi:hypothetical protein
MWFYEDYSSATVMVLFTLESIIAVILAVLFFWLLAPATERIENKTLHKKEQLSIFLLVAGILAVCISVFVAAIVFLLMKETIPIEDIKFGMTFILAFQFLEFFSNLYLLRPLSIKEGDNLFTQSLGGLALLLVSILMGFPLAFFSGDKNLFVLPFIIFKVIIDISTPIRFFLGDKYEYSPNQMDKPKIKREFKFGR